MIDDEPIRSKRVSSLSHFDFLKLNSRISIWGRYKQEKSIFIFLYLFFSSFLKMIKLYYESGLLIILLVYNDKKYNNKLTHFTNHIQ